MYNITDIRNCPKLIHLLVAVSLHRTFRSKDLGRILKRSHNTIRNEWTQICKYFAATSREEAYWKAVDECIVPAPKLLGLARIRLMQGHWVNIF